MSKKRSKLKKNSKNKNSEKDLLILEKNKLNQDNKNLNITTSSWLESDDCYCDSGIKIWNCHLKDKENKIAEFLNESERTNMLFKALNTKPGVKKCLIDNCENNTINSHYIPKNMLKKFGSKLIPVPMSNEKKEKEKGIKLISHKMFCKEHDNKIFSQVDNYPFKLNSQNLKMFSIRLAYMELTQKITIVKSKKELFLKNICFSADPRLIEQYKGNKLGISDLKLGIKNLLKKDSKIIYKIFNSKNKFLSGTCSNPIRYSDDDRLMYDIHDVDAIIPIIVTIVCPWGEKMIAISVFTNDCYNNREFNFVSKLGIIDLKKWFSSQLLNGQNFWTDSITMERMLKNHTLERFKILGIEGTQIKVWNNNYRVVPNLFDD